MGIKVDSVSCEPKQRSARQLPADLGFRHQGASEELYNEGTGSDSSEAALTSGRFQASLFELAVYPKAGENARAPEPCHSITSDVVSGDPRALAS